MVKTLKLKELRKRAGLSIAALSNLSGVSRRTIEDIETRGDCRISTTYVLRKALNYSLDDFYKEETEERSSVSFVVIDFKYHIVS